MLIQDWWWCYFKYIKRLFIFITIQAPEMMPDNIYENLKKTFSTDKP